MPEADMFALEKAALEDPFLADAMEGYEPHLAAIGADVEELRQRLHAKQEEKKAVAPVVPLRRTWWRAAAAAVFVAAAAAAAYQLVWKSPVTPIAATENTVTIKEKNTDTTREKTAVQKEDAAVASTENPLPSSEKNKSGSATVSQQKNTAATSSMETKDAARMEKDAKQAQQNAIASRKNLLIEQDAAKTRKESEEVFTGVVVDAQNKPIPGAIVQLEKEKIAVTTNDAGQFRIRGIPPPKVKDTASTANISIVGYAPGVAVLKPTPFNNKIELQQNSAALDEVVVVGYGNRKRTTVTGSASKVSVQRLEASPANGWPNYQQYLKDSARLKTPEGATPLVAIIAFQIRPSGKLSRFSIEQSAGKTYDQEAMRLIKSGPAWTPVKGKRVAARVIVSF